MAEITKADQWSSAFRKFLFYQNIICLTELWIFFYLEWCFLSKKCHFQRKQLWRGRRNSFSWSIHQNSIAKTLFIHFISLWRQSFLFSLHDYLHSMQHAACALSLRFVFPVWKWGAKMSKIYGKTYLWTTCESFEN